MAPVTPEVEFVRQVMAKAHRLARFLPDVPGLRVYWYVRPRTWDAMSRHVSFLEPGEGASMAERQQLYGIHVVRTSMVGEWDISLVIEDVPA